MSVQVAKPVSRSNGLSRRESRSSLYRLNRALIDAAADGDVEAVKSLISRGANVNFRNKDGETALTFTAAWNQPQALKVLLASGADPNIVDHTGGTALMLAAQHGTAQMVRELLRYHADPNVKDTAGFSALNHVDWRSHGVEERGEIRRLIERAAIEFNRARNGRTAKK